MDELNQKIREILNQYYLTKNDLESIRTFISKCTLQQFEEIKELDWELSQNQE